MKKIWIIWLILLMAALAAALAGADVCPDATPPAAVYEGLLHHGNR